MELLFFTDISQLDYVVANTPKLLTQMRPITGDFVVSYEFEKLGIDFIDEWALLAPDDIRKNWDTAYLLAKTWWDERLASTEYEGISLTEATKQDMFYSFEACLNARTVYQKLFRTYSIKRISGYFLPSVAVVRTGPPPTSRSVRSVVQGVLFYMAEKNDIPVIKLNTGRALSVGRIAFGKIAKSTHKTVDYPNVEATADKVVLIYENLIPPDERVALTEALDKLQGVRTISISQQALEMGSQIKSTESGCERRLHLFWTRFIESFNTYSGEYPEIFANSHLLFQFERIRDEMESSANYGEMFAVLLQLLKPSLVIFGYDAFTIERVLVRLARDREIPTLGLLHGGLGFRHCWRNLVGDVDALLVWNEIDIATLEYYGNNKSTLKKIGSLRYENSYIDYKRNTAISSHTARRTAKKRLLLSPEKPLIVLLTAEINTGFATALAYPEKHREAIRALLSLAASRPDLQFVIKAHPGFDYYELYRRLRDPKLPNFAFLEQVQLNEILEASDICLMINYPTTAALEAMLIRVPVIYLENAVYPIQEWQDILSATGIKTHCIKTLSELETRIDRLLSGSAVKHHALVEADKQLSQLLDVNAGLAQGRLFDFLRNAIHDQPSFNVGALINAKEMRKLLFSPSAKDDLLFWCSNTTTTKYSDEHLMCAFAYLAGINNVGRASISRIFDAFQERLKNESMSTWQQARWLLLPAYIAGNISSSTYIASKLSNIRLLSPYLIHPHKLLSAPTFLKSYVIMFLIQNTLGRSDVLLKAGWMLKRFLVIVAFAIGLGKKRGPRTGIGSSS